MAAATEAQPAIPDYMLDPNAVTRDEAVWRNGKAPDYSNTRRVWQESMEHCLYTPFSVSPRKKLLTLSAPHSEALQPRRRQSSEPGRELGQELGD
jgi:hypothetical protein